MKPKKQMFIERLKQAWIHALESKRARAYPWDIMSEGDKITLPSTSIAHVLRLANAARAHKQRTGDIFEIDTSADGLSITCKKRL